MAATEMVRQGDVRREVQSNAIYQRDRLVFADDCAAQVLLQRADKGQRHRRWHRPCRRRQQDDMRVYTHDSVTALRYGHAHRIHLRPLYQNLCRLTMATEPQRLRVGAADFARALQ